MRNSELLKQAIDDGLQGKNLGLSMGSTKLNNLTGGLQYGRYDLVGGTTGSSKTAFVDNFYILKPWFMLREARKLGLTKRTMKVFYWSLEIRKTHKLAKWLAWVIFQKYKILIDSKLILTMLADDEQLQKNRMSTELYNLIMSELDVLDEMEESIFIIDDKITPKGVYKSIKEYANNNGETTTIPILDRRGNFIHNKNVYKSKDPEELVLGIVDHLGLVSPDKEEGGKKNTIDTLSSFFVSLRNQHNYSFCAVSQFNRELADVSRQRFKELTPQMEDFKDTGGPSEDYRIIYPLYLNLFVSLYMSKVLNSRFLELYNQGLNDCEIGKILNVSNATITYRRQKRNLPKNFKYTTAVREEDFMPLYNEGLSDTQIARQLNVYFKSVEYLRNKLKLKGSTKPIKLIQLSTFQREALIGSLLGDGHLRKINLNACGDFAHSLAQKEYAIHKYNLFKDLCSPPKEESNVDRRNERTYYRVSVKFNSHPYLTAIYPLLYSNKIKYISDEIMSEFTDVSLAYLFMDDGYRGGNTYGISLNNFTIGDLESFKVMMLNKFSIKVNIHKNHVIYVQRESADLFKKAVEPYIISSLRYKLESSIKLGELLEKPEVVNQQPS